MILLMTMLMIMLVTFCILKIMRTYKNKVFTWNVTIKDSCLKEEIKNESKNNFQNLEECWHHLLLTTFAGPKTYYWKLKGKNRYTNFERYTCIFQMLENNKLLITLNKKLRIAHRKSNKLTTRQLHILESFRYQFLHDTLNMKNFCEVTDEEFWC